MNAYSDSALLDRWMSSRDPMSFREITLRHAGMVYATCKRILGNPADAEDVAQECFLALAQSRAGIQSLPGWLHTLAVRRSYNVVRGEKRRRAREQQYAAQASQDGYLGGVDATWEAVQEHVDQAIAELPEESRESIIAYFLEGRSQDEIARSYEVNQATVSRRITRGIELVRDSLRKQGVAISLAALTAMLGARMAEAAPPTLVSALGKLALTTARPLVAPAAKAVGLLSHKGTLAIIVVIVVGIAGVSAVSYQRQSETDMKPSLQHTESRQGLRQPQDLQVASSPPENPAVVADAKDAVPSSPQPGLVPIVASTPGACSVSGRVVDEAGKPVAGARLFARSSPMSVASGSTDKDGRFLIQGMESSDRFCMIAYTHFPEGKDCVATKIYGPVELTTAGLADLVLVAYAPGTITGSLVGQDGRPVPDAQLVFMSPTVDTQYDCIRVVLEPSGRFTATGVPCEELGVYVRIGGANIPMNSWLERVTLAPRQQLSGLNLVYIGGEVPHLTGKVVDDTGVPVGGAKITDYADRQEAQSNADGTFALRTTNDSLNSIVVRHPDYQDAVPSEDEHGNMKVVLHKANRLHGKVVSAATRQPVQSYRVLVHSGPLVQSDTVHWEKAVTVDDAEGRFDQPCSSRDVVTALFRADGFADFTMELNQVDREQEVTIALPAAQTLKGIVVDPEGQPVRDARICVDLLPRGIQSYKTNEKPDARSGADGSFALERLAAGEHFVLADHIEYGPVYQTIHVPQPEPVILALTQGCTLAGGYSGLPPHARCMLDIRHDQLMYRKPCNEDGTYKIAGLPAGTATVRCEYSERHGGWHDMWGIEKTVVFEDGKTTTLDFDWAGTNAVVEGTVSFTSAKDARLSAKVTGQDGSKLTAHVSVQPDGTFSIPRLFPGRVTLTATRIDQREVAEEISATVDAIAEATVNCNLVPSATVQ